jgi:transposase
MPRAIPGPLRRRIAELHSEGLSAPAIARALHLSPRSVRRLLRRLRQGGPAALGSAYHRCGRKPAPSPQALDLRRAHPSWGAPYLRTVLAEGCDQPLPCVRTLQRHFRSAGLQPAPAGRRPGTAYRRSQVCHEVWQLDACERIPLADGQEVSWLRVVDEHSGAFLQSRVFSLRLVAASAGLRNPGVPAAGLRPLRASPDGAGG